jgi:hypothetical protein
MAFLGRVPSVQPGSRWGGCLLKKEVSFSLVGYRRGVAKPSRRPGSNRVQAALVSGDFGTVTPGTISRHTISTGIAGELEGAIYLPTPH